MRGGLRRCVAALAAVAAIALAAAPAGLAHATLVSTDPPAGAVLSKGPAQVVLTFDEAVGTSPGSLRVFDDRAQRVDRGAVLRPAASRVAIRLAAHLRPGTYTVAWRVVSADTHPVHGAYTFAVGRSSGAGIPESRLRDLRSPRSVDVVYTVVRFAGLVSLLVLSGAVAALLLLLRGGTEALTRRLWAWLAVPAAVVAAASLAAIVLQGAVESALSIGGGFRGDVLSQVLDARYGTVWLARACACAALAVLLPLAARRGGAFLRVGQALSAAVAVALVLTPAATGHASVSGAWSWVLDVLHVAGAAVWVGGLAWTALALLLAGDGRRAVAAASVPRLSLAAVVSVAVLLVAGITNGYLQVRAWPGLWQTTYGRLLLAKVALVLPLLALGAYNNRVSVPRLRRDPDAPGWWHGFARVVAVELALMAVVVGVTAVLVAQPPARAAIAARSGPFSTSTQIGPYELNLTVDPARAGSNAIHLYLLDAQGRQAAVDEVGLEASLPSVGIGPLRLYAYPAGPGHYVVVSATIPVPGAWQLLVKVRKGDFDLYEATIPVPIGKAR